MNAERIAVLIGLAVVAAWSGGCSRDAIAQPATEQAQGPVAAGKEPTALASPTASYGEAVATPVAEFTETPAMVGTPTLTPEAVAPEEDCMAECHIPDPNDFFAAGAKPMPASHAGRMTCLVCHATAATPALPATHLGRLDESCQGCHVLQATSP